MVIIFADIKNNAINEKYPFIKKIIDKKSSLGIPTEFVIDHNSIYYLKSGKIDRNFYKKQYFSKNK